MEYCPWQATKYSSWQATKYSPWQATEYSPWQDMKYRREAVTDGNLNKMGNEFKAEARKQYLKYFRIWFLLIAALLIITVVVGVTNGIGKGIRGNNSAPDERVWDYADVLTDDEEDDLRDYIAGKEAEIQADIVLVTINEPMESYGSRWETAMMNYADDFYDNNDYGYDEVHGNGVLLLDNYYEGQAGSWLSTCGNVYEKFGDYEINKVLDAVYYGLDDGAYEAYKAYIDTTCAQMEGISGFFLLIGVLLIPIVVAVIFVISHLRQKKAVDTTNATTYVPGGTPVMNEMRDDFIRKNVVRKHIERSSSGSGRSGRGGSHRSSSGVRHGGGGRRR